MSDQGDAPGNEKAAAGAAAPSEDAYKSAVDLSDLETEATKGDEPKAGEGDDGEDDPAKSTDQGDADDKDESEEGESDDDGDPDGDDEGDEDEDGDEDKRPKRNRSQRYRDQIQRLQEENARLRGRDGGSLTDAQVEAKVKDLIGEPPQEKDFANYLDWERAATAYELDKRQTSRQVKDEAKRATEAEIARNVERVERYKERVDDFRSRGATKEEKAANAAEFDKVMSAAKDAKAAPHVEDLILDSKKSGHLVYYFAKNPDRLNQLNRMTEREAARAIGAIEARLSVPKPKTKSSAPPPPKTAPKGGAAAPSQDAELDAYIKRRYGPRS